MKLLLIFLVALFSDANQLYSDGNYAEAAKAYEEIITEQPNSEVYYNLGNAYFKQNELAKAILAYERCLRLDPRNKDAKYNLAFAQSRIIDNVEDNQAFFIKSWLQAVRNMLREQTWITLSIIMFFIVLIGALLFALSKEQWLRKTAFYIGYVRPRSILVSLPCLFPYVLARMQAVCIAAIHSEMRLLLRKVSSMSKHHLIAQERNCSRFTRAQKSPFTRR